MFEGSKLDTFFICLLIVAISIIFGMNVLSLIDKKISNVSINIPPIAVPQPSIVVHIHKSNGTIKTVSNGNAEDTNVNKNEHFASVSNEKDNLKNTHIEHIYDNDVSEIDSDKISSKASDIKIVNPDESDHKSNLYNPLDKDIVEYTVNESNKNKTTDLSDDNRSNIPQEKNSWVHCDNPSINEKFQRGKNLIPKNQIHACKDAFKPESYYKHYAQPIAHLEDYKLKGANYNDYNNTVYPHDAGVRLLPKDNKKLYPHHSKFDKIPKAMNHSF